MNGDKLLCQVNQTQMDYEKQKTIHQMFEEQVVKSKHRIAAVYHEESITYQELNEKANQVARVLRNLSIAPNRIVGLMVNRSLNMLIGMMGILKAGGCYLPIDPKFPATRIHHMLKDSKTTVLLTENVLANDIECMREFDGTIVCMDEDIYQGDRSNLDSINQGSDLAYVIYTSGSTGLPKGVMLNHRGVHNFILGMRDKIRFREDKKIVSLTTISFDIFVLESLLPLTMGMEIVIANPMTFAQDMEKKRVQMLQTTPSTLQLIINDERNHIYLDSLTDIMVGGEAFPPRLLKTLQSMTHANIYNMYGPTETTVWSMVKEVTHTNVITVGYPIANTQIYLLNEEGQPVSIGEEGEICIAGDGLALGYLNRPELTNERFVKVKSIPGSIMYRTGDLGRWLEDGEMEFLGRVDSQVKIRGFRIELGEIETQLQKVSSIHECVVCAKQNEDGDKFLVAYYVSKKYLVVSDLIAYLKTVLPEYEVPGIYMKIDEIPLTPNGKINRLALPDPILKRPNLNTEYVEPRTKRERQIASMWRQLLGYDTVGIQDNFFDLGGNSILVSQLHVELEKQYQVNFDIAELFLHNTITQQCYFIENQTQLAGSLLLKVLRLPEHFLADGIGSRTLEYSSVTLHESICRRLSEFAKYSQVAKETVYLTIFIFLLYNQTMQQQLEVLCQSKEATFRRIITDVSGYSDLQELCRCVNEKLNASSDFMTREELQSYNFEDANATILSFSYEAEQRQEEVLLYELKLEISKNDLDYTATLWFDRKHLNTKEIDELLNQYLQLLTTVAKTIE